MPPPKKMSKINQFCIKTFELFFSFILRTKAALWANTAPGIDVIKHFCSTPYQSQNKLVCFRDKAFLA
jgi:hypothetical protein